MFRQTTFIRSLKKVCKVLVLLQNWIASKSAQFFVVNSQTFFFKIVDASYQKNDGIVFCCVLPTEFFCSSTKITAF